MLKYDDNRHEMLRDICIKIYSLIQCNTLAFGMCRNGIETTHSFIFNGS